MVVRQLPASAHRLESGLHGAIGFPIVVCGEFFGVIEVFSRECTSRRGPSRDDAHDRRPDRSVPRVGAGRAAARFQAALLRAQGESTLDGILDGFAPSIGSCTGITGVSRSGVVRRDAESRDPFPVIEAMAQEAQTRALSEIARQFVDESTRHGATRSGCRRPRAGSLEPRHARRKTKRITERVLVLRDVNEQKRTEDRLRESGNGHRSSPK